MRYHTKPTSRLRIKNQIILLTFLNINLFKSLKVFIKVLTLWCYRYFVLTCWKSKSTDSIISNTGKRIPLSQSRIPHNFTCELLNNPSITMNTQPDNGRFIWPLEYKIDLWFIYLRLKANSRSSGVHPRSPSFDIHTVFRNWLYMTDIYERDAVLSIYCSISFIAHILFVEGIRVFCSGDTYPLFIQDTKAYSVNLNDKTRIDCASFIELSFTGECSF